MGLVESTNARTNESNELQTTPTRKHTNDPRYGGQVYLSPHTDTVYQHLHLQQKNLHKILELITRRKSLLHNNFLTVRNHFSKQEHKSTKFSCGGDEKYQFYLEYPYLKKTLEDVIEEYSARGVGMPEKEVVRIFGAVVGVLKFLQRNGTCHGDVKASNILFDHMGTPKLIDSYFINGGKTAYEIVLENPSSMSLLSPQQLYRVKHRQNEDITTIHQSEMFMVGLTMIEALTFQAAMECYNLETLEIVEGYYERKRGQLAQSSYSGHICELALRCVDEDWTMRPSFEQFLSSLSL